MDNPTLYRLAEEARALPIYPNALFPPSLYYRFLYRLAQYIKPVVSVELGLCGGGASLHMALGNPDGLVIGVDIVNEWPDRIEHIKAMCKNFEFWHMDSVDAADVYCDKIMPDVDILFIDTTHTYEQTMKEFSAWKPLLAPRSIVCLDDLKRPGMDKAWDDVPGSKVRIDWLHIGGERSDGGFGIVYDIPN